MATNAVPSGPPEIVKPSKNHTATVIFLHGLGSSGAEWLPVVDSIKNQLPHAKWVLPNAPWRKVGAHSGAVTRAWFDIPSFEWKKEDEDQRGLLESAGTIDRLIQAEVDAGLPADRIVLSGFSQGATLSLLTGLTAREDGSSGGQHGWRLGGIAVLSGWLPLQDKFSKIASPHLTKTAVCIRHGEADMVVPFSMAQKVRDTLTKDLHLRAHDDPGELGTEGLSFRSYVGVGHEASPQMLKDFEAFLRRALPE